MRDMAGEQAGVGELRRPGRAQGGQARAHGPNPTPQTLDARPLLLILP